MYWEVPSKMKTFRGPIDGFHNDDEDMVSDSDEEADIGHQLFDFGSDDDEEEFEVAVQEIVPPAGLLDLPQAGQVGNESSDDDADDEGEHGDAGTEDEDEGEASEDSIPDEEVAHDASSSSPVLLPSPGPEVEVESDLASSSPVVDLHRVYGELDIASRLAAQQSQASINEGLGNNNAIHQNGDGRASRSSSELSELSEPEDPELLRINGLTPTPSTPATVNHSEGIESPRILESADVTEDEEGESSAIYSNPMVSAEDEVDANRNDNASNPQVGENDEQLMHLRGDCIGSTTYSERHVLKILMKWMKQIEVIKEQSEDEKQVLELETEFDNELSFLWDMSSEKDVALYLSEKDIFALLRESLTVTECDRLVEIAIGILVNLLSVREILDKFADIEAKLQLIPAMLSELQLCRIPRLIQSLAFLRRIVWYMSIAEVVEEWMNQLTEPDFIQAVNFLLKSCRNVGILSELVTILFMLLEIIRDTHKLLTKNADPAANEEEASTSSSDDNDEVAEAQAKHAKERSIGKRNERIIYDFCKHGFITSLCESLQELLKYPVIDPGMWPNTSTAGRGDTNEELQVIPPNAIQESICLGLNTFEFIHKIKSCREFLYEDATIILNIYLEFYHRFHLYTQHVSPDTALDHFGEGLKLVGYYQSKLPNLISKSVIIKPLAAARKFKQQQESVKREKQSDSDEPPPNGNDKTITVTDDLVTSIAVLVHEFLAQLGEKFQLDKVHKIILDEKNEKLSRFLDFVSVAVHSVHQKCLQSTSVTAMDSDWSDQEESKKDPSEAEQPESNANVVPGDSL